MIAGMQGILVRPYQPADRGPLRSVCCDTAILGDPIDVVFPDREIVADLLSSYYTDHEPQAAWVAEREGVVGGYLTGCLNSRRYQRMMRWRIVPRTALKAALKGLLVEPATWRLFRAAVRTLQLGVWSEPEEIEHYPAHLHMNLKPYLRGQHLGEQLLDHFLAYARANNIPGACAAVRSDNPAACKFFQRQGFRELFRHPLVLPRGIAGYAPHDRIIYVKAL